VQIPDGPCALTLASIPHQAMTPTPTPNQHQLLQFPMARENLRTLLSSSVPFTLIKFAWLSFATTLADNVVPQPGGP
jgi:hypothetical protein